MKILIIGTGYVGLVSGGCLAELGNDIVCIDNNQEKVEQLISGQLPFYEPGLREIVQKNYEQGRLKFSNSLKDYLNQVDLVFIAVGTPPKENGEADLQYVFQVAEEIGKNLNKYLVVATKSTVPVGTGKKVKKIISKFYQNDFDVASCPEFLREGSAVKDFFNPDRIVIGAENQRAKEFLLQVHDKLNCEKLVTNIETAEMIKYASNAFLATKISFINEIANVCENVGANVDEVARGMGFDKRIGQHFLQAGIG